MLAAHAAMPVCSAAGVMTAMQPCMGSGRLAVYGSMHLDLEGQQQPAVLGSRNVCPPGTS